MTKQTDVLLVGKNIKKKEYSSQHYFIILITIKRNKNVNKHLPWHNNTMTGYIGTEPRHM